MQCLAEIKGDGCQNVAVTGKDFCWSHMGAGFGAMVENKRNIFIDKFAWKEELTDYQRGYIKHLGDKPKKIDPKPIVPLVYPEPIKEHVHLHDIMTMAEVAEYLSVSKMTLKRWDRLGRLKAIRINSRGDRRYLRSEINKLLGGNV